MYASLGSEPPAKASPRAAGSRRWLWWLAGGCGIAALALALVGGTLLWFLSSWWLPSEPWVEVTYASPDGRYIVYNEGRGIGLKLQTRATIAAEGDFDGREALLPWSRSLVRGVDWIGEREFVIDLDVRTSNKRTLDHRTWRDVRFTVDRH